MGGLKELHLTVNEWKAYLKSARTNKPMEGTILFSLLIYEAGLCYLSEAELIFAASPDQVPQAQEFAKYAQTRFNEVRKLTDRFSKIRAVLEQHYKEDAVKFEQPLKNRNDSVSIDQRLRRK